MRHIVASLVLTLMVAGCSSPGDLVARQDKDELPTMGHAPQNGHYGLFIAGQAQELIGVDLKKGQPLGFERGVDGIVRWLYAVAGTSRNRPDIAQVYEWRLQP